MQTTPDTTVDDKPARPRKVLGPAFWAGILFGLVCIFLGAVVGIWGSRIMPPKLDAPPPPSAVEPAHVPPAAVPPSARGPAPATPTPPAADANVAAAIPFDPASDTFALEQRLAQLETENRHRTEAAVAALAVVQLSQAAEGAAPFAAQVDAQRAVLIGSADTEVLRQLAAAGAPTRAMLAERFPDVAARAAAAARQAQAPPGFFARIARLFSGLVSVRRTDRLVGSGADAVLARAERAVGRGDLGAAARELAALPPAARAAADPWRQDAERRIAIESRLAALRASVSARLNAEAAQE